MHLPTLARFTIEGNSLWVDIECDSGINTKDELLIRSIVADCGYKISGSGLFSEIHLPDDSGIKLWIQGNNPLELVDKLILEVSRLGWKLEGNFESRRYCAIQDYFLERVTDELKPGGIRYMAHSRAAQAVLAIYQPMLSKDEKFWFTSKLIADK